jgi:hypothetical protein
VPPWVIWVPLLAALNLFVFVAIRGRWGRITYVLAAASVIGVISGDRLGAITGLDPLRVGDMHVLAASVTAQALMAATTLLAALGPVRVDE